MTKLSWDNPPVDDDELSKLCKISKSNDFYFYAYNAPNPIFGAGTTICITPKLYFQKENCLWDLSLMIEHLLPSDFYESMESEWESERSVDEVRSELLLLGFEENLDLVSFLSKERDYDN
ncbi:hypothetical protein UFOVP1290_452 [uncultured Caudovirales phage]|uniref:Uncharacterized protein n=1 Tax=uncultured Caudovirales phage TaxID=2100421 RepID=A0A6J5RLI8_9CAUD|nr:hypothetical protein UFOVP1290_452 [uncultured Caudovirales phage]